jgi:putative ABC transport system permease protein
LFAESILTLSVFNFRYALRSLARDPLVSIVTVVSLGVALGVATTMFAIIDSMRHPPRLLRKPSELYQIQFSARGNRTFIAPGALYEALSKEGRFHAGLAAERWMSTAVLRTPVDQRAVSAAHVTSSYFDVLGAATERGRVYRTTDDAETNIGSAIISHGLWRLLFAGQEDKRDQRIVLNDTLYTVVGVLPAAWLPLGFPSILIPEPNGAVDRSSNEFVRMFGRLRPGVTPQAAEAELQGFAQRLEVRAQDKSAALPPIRPALLPFQTQIMGAAGFQVALAAGALLMLVIACTNVTTLLLVRGSRRQTEMAVRAALGARRSRLVGLVLAESSVLTAGSAVLGIALSVWLVHLSAYVIPESFRGALGTPRLGVATFAFFVLASGITVVLAGLLPALRSARADPVESIKDSAVMTSARVKREIRVFVIAELAVSFVLLAGVAYVVQSIIQAGRVDFGIDLQGLYRTKLSPWDGSQVFVVAQQGRVDSTQRATYEAEQQINIRMRAAVEHSAGVMHAGTILNDLSVPRHILRSEQSVVPLESYSIVSATFFETIGLDVQTGTDLRARLDRGRGAVVDEILARQLFGTTNVSGRAIWLGDERSEDGPIPILGTVRPFLLDVPPGQEAKRGGELYVVDDTILPQGSDLLVRAAPGKHKVSDAIVRAMRDVSSRARFSPVALVHSSHQTLIDRQRFVAVLGGVVSGCGVLLSLIGLYGVVAFAVAQRRRELALRLAFGASPRQVSFLVAREGISLLLAGSALGLGATAGLSKVLTAAIYGRGANGIGFFAILATMVALSAATSLASWLPSRHALRTNAATLLRGGA